MHVLAHVYNLNAFEVLIFSLTTCYNDNFQMLLVTVMLEVMSIQSFNSERNIDKLLPPDILSTEARYVQKC